MPSVTWTPEALADVRRLHRFLADKNPDAARRAASRILDGARLLKTFPAAGRPAPNRPPECRELPLRFGAAGYLLLYRYDEAGVVILAVRSTREETF